METFEWAKTVAAFGGFFLSVLAWCNTHYEKYFRKGKLLVEVESASIKLIARGAYAFQINLVSYASWKDVFVREMRLRNSSRCLPILPPPGSNVSPGENDSVPLHKAIPYTVTDILSVEASAIEPDFEQLWFRDGLTIRDLRIGQDSQMSLTILGYLASIHDNGHVLSLPLDGWSIEVEHRDSVDKTSFRFEAHVTNSQETKQEIKGPRGLY